MVKVYIDLSDLCKLAKYSWYRKSNQYIAADVYINKKRTHLYLHRQIMQAPDNLVVDHVNGNVLDNRKSNLRVVTQAFNGHNRHNRTHKYLGVYPVTKNGSWNVKLAGMSLGTYYTEDDAALVADQAARLLYNRNDAAVNLPEKEWPGHVDIFTTSKYGYKGVERNHIGKFSARYQREHLGCFTTAEEAYAVYASRYWQELWQYVRNIRDTRKRST